MGVERAIDHLDETGRWSPSLPEDYIDQNMKILRSQDDHKIPFQTGWKERFEPRGTIANAIKAATRNNND